MSQEEAEKAAATAADMRTIEAGEKKTSSGGEDEKLTVLAADSEEAGKTNERYALPFCRKGTVSVIFIPLLCEFFVYGTRLDI